MEKIFRVKYIAIIINVFIGLNTLGLIGLGIYRTYHAFQEFRHLDRLGQPDYHPGIEFAEALDIFMIALVFLVFTIGINSLFIRYGDKEFLESIPEWMQVKSFTKLKFLVMEAIIATMFIFFVSEFAKRVDDLGWDFLVLPISIALLAISLKVLMWKSKE